MDTQSAPSLLRALRVLSGEKRMHAQSVPYERVGVTLRRAYFEYLAW